MSKIPKIDLDCYWSGTGRAESTRVNPFTRPLNPAPALLHSKTLISGIIILTTLLFIFSYWRDSTRSQASESSIEFSRCNLLLIKLIIKCDVFGAAEERDCRWKHLLTYTYKCVRYDFLSRVQCSLVCTFSPNSLGWSVVRFCLRRSHAGQWIINLLLRLCCI